MAFNKAAMKNFGESNIRMSSDSSSLIFDNTLKHLHNHIDIMTIRRWAIKPLKKAHKTIRFLDVGAGKGRITRLISPFVDHVTAIEPFEPFFKVLLATCSGADLYYSDLNEYFQNNQCQHELIFISVVFNYLDENEFENFLKKIFDLLQNNHLMFVRSFDNLKRSAHNGLQINRTPEQIIKCATKIGFNCLRHRIAYPPIAIQKILDKYNNVVSNAIYKIAYNKLFYPIWYYIAELNLPRFGDEMFCYYLFEKRVSNN